MQTISLCMIVRDEEKTIANCLSSVAAAVDEIVIVDTGSKDKTKDIAKKYTDKIYDFTWADDFAKARNFSFAAATKDYILWLDADDVLLPKDRDALISLKATLSPAVDGVMMKDNTGFDEEGNVTFSYFRERLVKRARCFQWQEPVHEYLKVSGNVVETEIAVTHTKKHKLSSDRNMMIYEKRLQAGEELSPQGLYYYARELKDHKRYEDATRFFLSFLDGGKGWVEDNIAACGELAFCYKQQKQPEKQQLALMRSFLYDTPRGETCCSLGYFYKAAGDYPRLFFGFAWLQPW